MYLQTVTELMITTVTVLRNCCDSVNKRTYTELQRTILRFFVVNFYMMRNYSTYFFSQGVLTFTRDFLNGTLNFRLNYIDVGKSDSV
jgi:hypothetical protein